VLDVCEQAVLHKGRDLHKNILAQAVTRRIAAAEKKGPRSGPARAGDPKRTAAKPFANTSRPSAS
jgi:hypothetical protein